MKSESSAPDLKYLLDTSALIAHLAEEPGGEQVRAIRTQCALPFIIVLTELYYVSWRHHNQVLADQTIQQVMSWHLPLLLPDQRISLSAGYLKARYRLGVADCYVAALALAYQVTLVTCDTDFRALAPELKLLPLRL